MRARSAYRDRPIDRLYYRLAGYAAAAAAGAIWWPSCVVVVVFLEGQLRKWHVPAGRCVYICTREGCVGGIAARFLARRDNLLTRSPIRRISLARLTSRAPARASSCGIYRSARDFLEGEEAIELMACNFLISCGYTISLISWQIGWLWWQICG